MLQDDEKKSQQRWMDIGDNARKDISAIFKLFIQARQNQGAQPKPTPNAAAPQPQATTQKRASPQRGLSETLHGMPLVDHIQHEARLQATRPPTASKGGLSMPSKVPTKLKAMEQQNNKRALTMSEEEKLKRSTAKVEHVREQPMPKVPKGSPYATGVAQPPVYPTAVAQRLPAGATAIQPFADRPRKRVS